MSRDTGELIDGIDPEMIEQKQTTDHPIPDDVMRAASKWTAEVYQQETLTWFDVRDVIARALLAERQRAAEIARKTGEAHLKFAELGLPIEPSKIIAEDRARVANNIARAILAQGEKP